MSRRAGFRLGALGAFVGASAAHASTAEAAPNAAAPSESGAPQARGPVESATDAGAVTLNVGRQERRSGLVLGLSLGYGVASSSGYPNESSKINDPRYFVSSGALAGSGETVFLMGALTDYVNFGVWGGGASYTSPTWRSTGAGGGLRVELFPLYALVPALRDIGVLGQFGVGSTKLAPTSGLGPTADGVQSFLGLGAFWDFRLFGLGSLGHVAGGPSLEYDAVFSGSAERHGALLGLRLAYYGGP